jgi:hypothetical protein
METNNWLVALDSWETCVLPRFHNRILMEVGSYSWVREECTFVRAILSLRFWMIDIFAQLNHY